MCVIFLGLVVSLVTVIVLLPHSVSFGDAVYLAGAAGRLNAVTTHFDWNDRFNVWSGLIGGTFLFLSYFGCDQSQVQRYLTGKIDRGKPPEPAVQRRGQDSDAVLHSVHRRHGVRVLSVRRSRRCCFEHAQLARIQVRRGVPAGCRRITSTAFEQRRAGGSGAGGGAPRRRLRRGEPRRSPPTARRSGRWTDAATAAARSWWTQFRRRKGLQRYQLYLPVVRDALSAGRDWWGW